MSKELHDEIMNLPCNYTRSCFPDEAQLLAYKEGHRDARHTAAELAIAADDLVETLKIAHKRINQLQSLVAERDAMLGKRPCQNSRCSELNTARALLREVLEVHDAASSYDLQGIFVDEFASKIRAHLDACDTLEGK